MTKVKKFYVESELVFEEKPKNKQFKDIEGEIFGKLAVIGFAGNKNRYGQWFCKCECGNITKVYAISLKSGDTNSCGCIHIDGLVDRVTIHGHSRASGKSSTYTSWNNMVNRCKNPNVPNYSDYGGRGIKVCDRWLKFENFLADMGEKPKRTSIERINNNGDYEPGNCRWATNKEQQNNKRNNRLITFNGKTQTMAQWAEEFCVEMYILSNRINRDGWTIERALTTKIRRR